MAWTAASSNIWGNGGLPTFASRATTRDNSSSRDPSQRPHASKSDEVEGKSGSGSLVDGSFSMDNWNSRSAYGAKRNLTTNRSLSQAGFPDTSASQQRSVSNAAAQTSLSGASQNFPFTSRPPPVSLNSTTSAQQRPVFGNTLPNNLPRGIDQPPTVYTKFDRPAAPLKKADSAIGNGATSFWSGTMSNISPTEERWPRSFAQSRNDSLSASREASQPPSRHSDGQSSFQPSDYQRSAPRTTPASSRAPSIASQSNGGYAGYASHGPDQLAMQFGQLNMNGNSRPTTSYKPAMPTNGYSTNGSTFNPGFSFGMPPTNGVSRGMDPVEDVEEIDRFTMQALGLENYLSPPPQVGYTDYGRSYSVTRLTQGAQPNDVRNIQPFRPSTGQTRSYDGNASFRPGTSEYQGYANGLMPADRRLPSAVPDPQLYMTPQLEQLLAQQLQRNGFAPFYSPYPVPNGMQMPAYYPLLTPLTGVDPYATARDMPPGDGVQSALMYEFKSNTKTKRYELKDIYNHIAEFAGDQHGSRFIQTKLETANSDEKERVFREIEPNALQLMTDVFGNYVIQKFFEHGDQTHKKILANRMRGRVLELSMQMYGCRVVQKALDHVLVDQQGLLVSELEDHVLRCVKDQNGNHVIQKAIERCPPQNIAFIFEAFRGQVASLSIHCYGCRVIQRCLEHCEPPAKGLVLKELLEPQGIPSMISNEYGNYVVQHIVAKDNGPGKQRVLDIILQGLEGFSKHKFASNVVEKCLEQADDMWRRRVVYKLSELSQHRRMEGGEDVIVGLIKDNFGNYVIQKLLDTLCPEDFAMFLELLQPAMTQAKRTGCGKQTQSIEKKMDRYMRPTWHNGSTNGYHSGHGHNPYQLALPTPPFTSNYHSAANTPPPLTADTQSLLSSAIPSINGDAVEGADRSRKSSEPSNDGRYER